MERAAIDGWLAELEAVLRSAQGSEHRAERPGSWSVAEIAEHVAATNLHLLRLASTCAAKSRSKAARGEAADPRPRVAAHEIERIASGDFRWDAPAHMLPRGAALQDSLGLLVDQRAEVLRLHDELCAPPETAGRLHSVAMSVLGPEARIALPELLVFLALHARRHAHQARRALGAG
jgi:hypothetical protein